MKSIGSYLQKKQSKESKKTYKSDTISVIDSKTIFHLFSHAIRKEYGRQGEKNIIPKFYKNGIIFVQINNSIWAQELWMQRQFFIKQINKKIGSGVLKNIKLSR